MASSKLEMILSSKEKDIGGFTVRRLLPYPSHRRVGPFVFFDHMGPAEFKPGFGMDVRPHPHINLATVTYLFEGKIHHQDSLGSDLNIEPGAVNWMTAGRGIVHSERTPDLEREQGSKLSGIQLWVAMPEQFEEISPSFAHHPKESLPEFKVGDVEIKLLLGEGFGHKSPVKVHSDLFYADIHMKKESSLHIQGSQREIAFYVVSGSVEIDGQTISVHEMAIGKPGEDFVIESLENSRMMIIAGSPVGERFLFWNFVSSSKERIEEAKLQWAAGPTENNSRFQPIRNDRTEFIPLPSEALSNKGTIM